MFKYFSCLMIRFRTLIEIDSNWAFSAFLEWRNRMKITDHSWFFCSRRSWISLICSTFFFVVRRRSIGKSGNGGWKRLWRTSRLVTFPRYRRQMKGLLLLFITITDDRRVKLWTFADLSVRTYFFFTTAISLRTHTFFCDSNSLRTQCHFE
jgi:hypothetical protein